MDGEEVWKSCDSMVAMLDYAFDVEEIAVPASLKIP